jgi:hypothetical protein
MYILFCKIKNIIVSGRISTTGRGYGPSTTRRSCRTGLATIKWLCLGPARQTQFIWPSIPSYDNDGPRLSCRHLVRHPAYFLSPLMPPPPRHPILDKGVGADASSSYSSDTSSDTDPRSGYCTSTRTFPSMGAPSFSPSSDVPFVFPTFALFFHHKLLPRPWSQPRADRPSSTRVRASRSCSWPFSVRAAEEDTVAPATLRLSW